LGSKYLPEWAKSLGLPGYLESNAGYVVQILSGVLAILTLIFQPNGLGTFTSPVGKWLKGERFSLHDGASGPGAEGVSARP
jgi:hypothetical protein